MGEGKGTLRARTALGLVAVVAVRGFLAFAPLASGACCRAGRPWIGGPDLYPFGGGSGRVEPRESWVFRWAGMPPKGPAILLDSEFSIPL
jgi:hypothetical protein